MHRAGIVGLGKIAAMYEKPGSPYPYCHAGGILQSEKVELTAVAEMSDQATANFRGIWGREFPDLRYYASSIDMLHLEQLDIASICVRGPHHFKVFMEAVQAGVRSIFLEKPPSCSLSEMDNMLHTAKQKHIPITVSYSRHWHPSLIKMQELVQAGLVGKVHTVVSYSGGAVLSYASHATDMICQFAGAGSSAYSVKATGSVPNTDVPQGYEPEPRLDRMVIEFDNGVTGLQIGQHGEHGEFYCQVFGSEGSIKAGMYTEPVFFNKKGEVQELSAYQMPEQASVFLKAYDQISDYLAGGSLPHCTNEAFVTVHEIGFAAIESIHSGQAIRLPNERRHRKIFANS
ncbi:hypothetical protein GC096_11385 [Paenibacillus sp. LMG 31461]|uniref:Gfo/Idh/MocA family oxidoreductase n=1 Tax=Paenibacillus plantarum TaxID=2654975 RepID=A0ABX1X868_9BACL|nr:Gfo/Idh/MocA family oxidoreductase [Paenibacillus plantarum]NOU64632.1 hypothetical protein [Paenibacillus plantarum]